MLRCSGPDAGFVGGCARHPFAHSTLNNLRLGKIDPTTEARAVREESMDVF